MGCELGKLASSGDSKKDVDNNVNEPPAPSAPDPRLPLTARQKYSMVASWKGISRAMETTGINMFIKWVSKYESESGEHSELNPTLQKLTSLLNLTKPKTKILYASLATFKCNPWNVCWTKCFILMMMKRIFCSRDV